MLIRAEQMTVFETTAEDNFVRRIAKHLIESYAKAIVRLPENVQSPVDELPKEKLYSLVEVSIERARRYDLSYESSIAAFTALMFEVAPNFDSHRLIKMLLNDQSIEPEKRLDELLKVLNEKNWETIRSEYDETAWLSKTETTENSENAEQSGDAKNFDSAQTVMNVENAEKPAKSDKDADYNFIDTIPNLAVRKG